MTKEMESPFEFRRIYLASSWRNPVQPELVTLFRDLGHEVYDFRNPRPGDKGFHWSEIDPEWLAWHPRPYRAALAHPVAQSGFKSDFGAGTPTAILLHEDKFEPELMYLMADLIAVDATEVCDWLDGLSQQEVAA